MQPEVELGTGWARFLDGFDGPRSSYVDRHGGVELSSQNLPGKNGCYPQGYRYQLVGPQDLYSSPFQFDDVGKFGSDKLGNPLEPGRLPPPRKREIAWSMVFSTLALPETTASRARWYCSRIPLKIYDLVSPTSGLKPCLRTAAASGRSATAVSRSPAASVDVISDQLSAVARTALTRRKRSAGADC